jgi:hypothetical protein
MRFSSSRLRPLCEDSQTGPTHRPSRCPDRVQFIAYQYEIFGNEYLHGRVHAPGRPTELFGEGDDIAPLFDLLYQSPGYDAGIRNRIADGQYRIENLEKGCFRAKRIKADRSHPERLLTTNETVALKFMNSLGNILIAELHGLADGIGAE